MVATTKVAPTVDNKQLREKEKEHKFKRAWNQELQSQLGRHGTWWERHKIHTQKHLQKG